MSRARRIRRQAHDIALKPKPCSRLPHAEAPHTRTGLRQEGVLSVRRPYRVLSGATSAWSLVKGEEGGNEMPHAVTLCVASCFDSVWSLDRIFITPSPGWRFLPCIAREPPFLEACHSPTSALVDSMLLRTSGPCIKCSFL